MKAKPIVYRGIHFRSKTEARWYIFMKKLGWNVEYEPEIPGLYGWLPDFIILGPKGSKVLVEVKPFKNNFDFESNYGIETLYSEGLIIKTSLNSNLQNLAEKSLINGLIKYDKIYFKFSYSGYVLSLGSLSVWPWFLSVSHTVGFLMLSCWHMGEIAENCLTVFSPSLALPDFNNWFSCSAAAPKPKP